jgi:hypothetical protein
VSTEPDNGRGCAAYRDELALVALGTSSGRERAEILAHCEECAECAAELERLSVAADALLLVAPEATPPVGFASRVAEQMGAGRERHRVRTRVLAIAVAVTLLVGFGAGVLATRSSGHDNTFISARLTSATGTTGDVMLSRGPNAWLFMTLDDAPATGQVTCEVTLQNGRRIAVGHYVVRSGYGAWAVWLQMPATSIHRVDVIDRSGVVLASATFAA